MEVQGFRVNLVKIFQLLCPLSLNLWTIHKGSRTGENMMLDMKSSALLRISELSVPNEQLD